MTILATQSRASIENPSTSLSDPAAWLFDSLGGQTSDSGMRVNQKTALTYSPLWRAVNVLSRDVAKLPLDVMKRIDGGKERDRAHPAHRLLRWRPNNEMTAFTFKQILQAHALLQGNGYAAIIKNDAGDAIELIPLDPAKTYPVRRAGVLWYITTVNNKLVRMEPADVLHIKGLGFDGLCGYSVIALATNSIGLGMAAEKYQNMFFKNNARPSVIIEHPKTLDDKARNNLRASWDRMHSGLNNAHRAAILEEGMKISAFAMNARDAQLVDTRKLQVKAVSNWTGVPAHKLGDDGKTSFSSLEEENQSYLNETIDGWLIPWEEETREKLLTDHEKEADTHVTEFNRKALVRANMAVRGAFYVQATGGAPWMTQNEVRRAESMVALEDPSANELHVPLNLAGADTSEPADGDRTSQAIEALVSQTAERMARRLGIAVRKQVKVSGISLANWITDGIDSHRDAMAEIFAMPVEAYSAITNEANGTTADMVSMLVEDLIETTGSCLERDAIATDNPATNADTIMDTIIAEWPKRAVQILKGETDGA